VRGLDWVRGVAGVRYTPGTCVVVSLILARTWRESGMRQGTEGLGDHGYNGCHSDRASQAS